MKFNRDDYRGLAQDKQYNFLKTKSRRQKRIQLQIIPTPYLNANFRTPLAHGARPEAGIWLYQNTIKSGTEIEVCFYVLL